MFIINMLDDWDRTVMTWKTDDLNKAERFVKYKEKEQGIYGENSFYIERIDEMDEVPEVTDEILNKVEENWNKEFLEYEARTTKQLREMQKQLDEEKGMFSKLFEHCEPIETLTIDDIKEWSLKEKEILYKYN